MKILKSALGWIAFTGIFLTYAYRPETLHHCRISHCPYENIPTENWTPKLSECEEGTDCYIMDLLHFENPNLSPAELEKLMWTPKN